MVVFEILFVVVMLVGDCENTINGKFVRIAVIPKNVAIVAIDTNCILAT
jgi:hypothetical protein